MLHLGDQALFQGVEITPRLAYCASEWPPLLHVAHPWSRADLSKIA